MFHTFLKTKSVQGFSKPVTFVIPWTHAPVASKLGASPLKQSRHHGTFLLMELHKRARCFAQSLYAFLFLILYTVNTLISFSLSRSSNMCKDYPDQSLLP